MSAQPDVSPAACTARLAVGVAREWVREAALAIDAAATPAEIDRANERFVEACDVLQEALSAAEARKPSTP